MATRKFAPAQTNRQSSSPRRDGWLARLIRFNGMAANSSTAPITAGSCNRPAPLTTRRRRTRKHLIPLKPVRGMMVPAPDSTSRLLELVASGNHLRTRTQMAFWLAPGERSGGQLARNTNTLSNYVLTKDVTIGFERWPQALDYRVTFSLPAGAHHVSAQFEALTGYMPPEFSSFWEFNPVTGKLQPLSDGPGEINNPVVLAMPDGKFAMGIFSPPQTQPDTSGPPMAAGNLTSSVW